MQILEIPAQRKFVSPTNCGSYSFSAIIKMLTALCCSHQTSKNCKYERKYLGNYQR